MLWIALHFPALPLEIFSRGAASDQPLAVVEKQGNRAWVMNCNEAASACGVQPGMPASAAQALATNLIVRVRDLASEQDSLAGIAAWTGRFTPSVSLQPPEGLLLEIGSCLRLHRGLRNLLTMVRSGLDEMGYAAHIACAPTPHGAWLLALAGADVVIRDAAQLERVLGALPVRLLDQRQDVVAGLEMVGARTISDCLRLPRAGLARRFGRGLLNEIERALGHLPEAREFFLPPPTFERRLELPAQVHEAQALLFAARRLLPELEGYLNLLQAGVQELELVCCHEDVDDTVLKLGFVKATRALDRMQLLLRETLANTRLQEAVHTIVLRARVILPITLVNADLFQDNADTGEGNLLLERLRIRLGKDAVYGIAPTADHRPELAWRKLDAGDESKSPGNLRRPLWLLPKPVPCAQSHLRLQSGPERIESGWWDGRDAGRDYYVAQDGRGARLWVYHDHSNGGWFVHGLFA